jgi:deoxyribonuclease-4
LAALRFVTLHEVAAIDLVCGLVTGRAVLNDFTRLFLFVSESSIELFFHFEIGNIHVNQSPRNPSMSSSLIHVRQLVQQLDYSTLVRSGAIPDLKPPVCVARRYPPVVYKSRAFSFFGMFMDYVVRKAIRNKYPNTVLINNEEPISAIADTTEYTSDSNWRQSLLHVHRLICALYGEEPYSDPVSMQGWIAASINGVLAKLEEPKLLIYNSEYMYGNIVGHPDIVTDRAVLEIKNTTSLTGMFQQAVLQTLTYAALIRYHGEQCTEMGFVLPVQKTVVMYDLREWDHESYLHSIFTPLSTKRVVVIPIGSHVAKGKDLASSLVINPCQMFLRNPRSKADHTLDTHELAKAAEKIKNEAIRYFTHAPYTINLCSGRAPELDILISDLESTCSMGGEGVVVHVGKHCKQSMAVALDTMEVAVKGVLPYATTKCRLLLETPAGMGTEVCDTLREMASFYTRFSADELSKLGICIDTCHVFAAGYDPLHYLSSWSNLSDVPICLVHFNDSRREKGSRVDRHAPVGNGLIGQVAMEDIARWCHERCIPMVTE